MITTLILMAIFVGVSIILVRIFPIWNGIGLDFFVEECVVFLIIIVIVSCEFICPCLYKKKYSTDTENQRIFSLKDTSANQVKGTFILATGHMESDEVVTYKYCAEATVDGKKVKEIKFLKADNNEIYFDESLKKDESPRLEIRKKTTYKELKHPEKSNTYKKFVPGYHLFCNYVKECEYTETKYVFVVPEGSISYDFNVDME